MRMSRAWLRLATFVPKSIDVNEALRVVFWPFHRLEAGVLCDVAGVGDVLLKGSVYQSIADSPQQAGNTYTKATNGEVHCVSCLHGSDTIAKSDKVRVTFFRSSCFLGRDVNKFSA